MSATLTRAVVSTALVAGLFAGIAAPGVADHEPSRKVAVKSAPLIKKKCLRGFRADWRKLNHGDWAHAYEYYEARRKAEQVIYDQLRWLLADPNAHDLIPGHEAAAAIVLAQVQPIVAGLRDENTRSLKAFESKYTGDGCLSRDGERVFKRGMRALRASFKDIDQAHQQLFRANMAVQTAQADLAGQCLQDADIEAATISENWQRSYDEFRTLRFPK